MSHQSLIEWLTAYYETLAALRYIKTSEIIYPPHKNVDVEAAREQDFSDDMISLMRQLPYLSADCDDTPLLPLGTKPRSYLDEDYLDWARDPLFQGVKMTKSTHIVLTNQSTHGIVLIYDAEACKLIPWRPSEDAVSNEIKKQFRERAADGLEYAHLPSFTPEELLGQWIQKWISLTWLPYSENNGWRTFLEEPSNELLLQGSKSSYVREQCQETLVRRTLKDIYVAAGWDVNTTDPKKAKSKFDGDAFDQKRAEWKKSTQRLLDLAYLQTWTWSKIRSELNLPSESASILDPEPKPTANDLAQSKRMGRRPDASNACARLKL